MSLEGIMLSKISEIQKDQYCMIPLTCDASSSQIHRDRKVGWWLLGAGGREEKGIIV